MISGARKLPTQHLSIRAPWHDAGWAGTVCTRPDLNGSCRALSRIAEEKDDAAEVCVAGQSLEALSKKQLPPCVDERAFFMAPFAFTQSKNHPYAAQNPELYGHFRETSYTTQPYSAASVPFRWMLTENVAQLSNDLQIEFREEREPALNFKSAWIQERTNQLVVLDTFFGAVEPKQSLCFFYAKDTPLSSSGRRVILGVGRVISVGCTGLMVAAPCSDLLGGEHPPNPAADTFAAVARNQTQELRCFRKNQMAGRPPESRGFGPPSTRFSWN